MKSRFLLFTLVGFILISCNTNDGRVTETESLQEEDQLVTLSSEQVRNAGVEYGQPGERLLSSDIHAKGRLIVPPDAEADVLSFYEGMISKIHVELGDYVSRGKILASVMSPGFIQRQQDYITARNKYELSETAFSRQQKLFEENVSSAKQFQQAKAEYLESKSEFNALVTELKFTGTDFEKLDEGEITELLSIRSPISGYINEVNIRLGKYIDNQEVMFNIIDRSRLLVELLIFEKDIMKIEIGQSIDFSLANLEAERYYGKIAAISSDVEQEAKVVRALASFDSGDKNLLPGMFVASRIHTNEGYFKALPEDAILFDGNDTHFVYYTLPELMKDDRVSYRIAKVTTGYSEQGFTQVEFQDEIPEAAKIVVNGAYYIHSERLKSEE